MAYASIEKKVFDLLTDAFTDDDDVTITRGFHSANALQSIAVRPGAADRQAQGTSGRVSTWVVEVAIKISSGLDLADWHTDVLSIRQAIIDELDSRPTLDGTPNVTGCLLATIGEPTYDTSGRTHTFEQVCFVEVKEYALLTGVGEYA